MKFASLPRDYHPNGGFGEYGGAALRVAERRLWAELTFSYWQ